MSDGERYHSEPIALGQGITSIVIRTRRPLRTTSSAEAEALGAIQFGSVTESWLGVPIPAGDRVLSQVATRLRQGGEAYRLGGDEFALLFVDHDEGMALAAANSIVERIATVDFDHIGTVTVSAGLATFPMQGHGRDELIRLADSALYWAKEHGKNRVRLYRPEVVELSELKRLAAGPDPERDRKPH